MKPTIRNLLGAVLGSRVAGTIARAGYHVCVGNNSDAATRHAASSRIAQSQVAEMLLAHGINCVLDVGANQGQFGVSLRSSGYEGLILSFEPNATAYEALTQKLDARWHSFPVALGDVEEHRDLNLMQHSVFTSFLEPTNRSTDQFREGNAVTEVATVQARRLDSFLNNVPLPPDPKIFLKCDTQGYDLRVIRGAGTRLDNIFLLQTELSMVPIYDGMPDYLETLRFCDSLGFVPAAFFPVTNDERTLGAVEFDCLMVRRSSKSRA